MYMYMFALENCTTVSLTLATCNAAMQILMNMQSANLQLQCRPTCTISLQVQSVLTVLSVHAQYMFCGTIVVSCVDFELHNVAK